MIVTICFFFFETNIRQSQEFTSLIIRFQETESVKLTQEKRGYCKNTCDMELESCQELKISLAICSFFMVSYYFFSMCSVLAFYLLTVSSLYLFCFFKTSLCPRSCYAKTLVWFNDTVFTMGYIVQWYYFSVFPSSDLLELLEV